MAEICVAHLVRARNGMASFRGFLESYARGRAGAKPNLLTFFNGFPGLAAVERGCAKPKAVPHWNFICARSEEAYDHG